MLSQRPILFRVPNYLLTYKRRHRCRTRTRNVLIVSFVFSRCRQCSSSFYPNVTTWRSGLCCRKSICPTVVCRPSVTLVHPTFGNIFHRCVRWPSSDLRAKFYGDRPMGTPPPGALKTQEGIKIERWWTYLINCTTYKIRQIKQLIRVMPGHVCKACNKTSCQCHVTFGYLISWWDVEILYWRTAKTECMFVSCYKISTTTMLMISMSIKCVRHHS